MRRAAALLLTAALGAVGCGGGVSEREPEAAPDLSGYTVQQGAPAAADDRAAPAADTYSIVRQAIISKEQIVATYDGHRREMSPHVIGTKNGREQALFFQFGGSSSSGLPPGGGWRCMTIDGLSGVSVREGEWHTAASHNDEPQTCVDVVDAHVAR